MRYHNIKHDDMCNGEGLRVTLFVSGCSFNCKGCQNPQTHDPNSGIEFDSSALKEIESQLKKDYIDGITLSGGDPLYNDNIDSVYTLLFYLKNKYPNKTVWIYTGNIWCRLIKSKKCLEILKLCDVLVDGLFKINLLSPNTPWVGSSNQRVINVKESLLKGKVILY